MNTPHRRRADLDPSYRPLAQQRPTHEEIARRAYQLFEQRGGDSGYALDDWLQAERDLLSLLTHRATTRV